MLFNIPICSEKADRLIELVELDDGDRVLDAGCGGGEFLLRTLEQHHRAHGLGIDRDAASVDAAQRQAAARSCAARCEFRVENMREFRSEPASFGLGICLGSTHAFGDGERAYIATIDALKELVRPGGLILIGEGYWKVAPAAEYLELLGDPPGIYRNHAENVAVAEQRGLVPLYAAVSNDDEWDDFEWRHRMRFERAAEAEPASPQAASQLARSRRWRDGYLRWGRDTMGFGFYLFRVPGSR